MTPKSSSEALKQNISGQIMVSMFQIVVFHNVKQRLMHCGLPADKPMFEGNCNLKLFDSLKTNQFQSQIDCYVITCSMYMRVVQQ